MIRNLNTCFQTGAAILVAGSLFGAYPLVVDDAAIVGEGETELVI